MQRFVRKAGATSQIIPVSIFDSSSTTGAKLAGLVYNSAGLTAYYNRIGASGAATAITLVTATKGTWASSGFVAIDGTNMPGDYELHIPDAVLAAGAVGVLIQLKGATNMVPVNIYIDLTVFDLQTATQGVDVTKILGTAPTEGAAGRLAAAFTKFFDKATPTGTINSLPDAVAGAAGGLPTTNGTKVSQTVDLTAGQSIAVSDKTGFSLSATGADLILKSSTFVQAIVAAINEFATYGLTALNTLLVTTGIKTATTAAPTDMALNSTVAKEATSTSILSKLLKYVQLLARKDAAIATDNATELTAINANGGSGAGAFDNTTDAGEAIRDRGDASWVTGSTPPTAAAIADQVWDEAIAGHLGAGSTGEKLNAAGSAGDPWTTALPGAYGAGSAGKIIGDNLNATVSSRSTYAGGAVASVTAAVTVGTNNDKTGYSLSSAGVQAIWDALTSALTTVGSVGKKLADWIIGTTQTADVATRPTLGQIEASTLAAADDAVLAQVALVKSVTDKLNTAVELDGAVYRLTTNALELAPGGGGGVIVIPVVPGRPTTISLVENIAIELVQGDTYRFTFSLGQDYSGWTPRFGARLKNADGTYAATYSMSVRDGVWTDATIGAGYVDITATDTAVVAAHYAELEMVNGSLHNTRQRYTIAIRAEIII